MAHQTKNEPPSSEQKSHSSWFLPLLAVVAPVGVVVSIYCYGNSIGLEDKDKFDWSLQYGGTVFLALLSVALLYRRTLAQEQLVKNQLIAEANERFSRAIDQLGAVHGPGGKECHSSSAVIEVRMGGLYTLEELVRENPTKFHNRVLKILCAYVRQHTPPSESPEPEHPQSTDTPHERTSESESATKLPKEPREDVQTALTITGSMGYREGAPEINLRGRCLRGANLQGLDLQKADLHSADLQNANLKGADLRKADFQYAQLQKAQLHEAKLQKAVLQFANLQGAILPEAQLQDARLQAANLRKSTLYGANMQRAILVNARLQGANLRKVDLQDANLHGADLGVAYLNHAILRNTKMENTYLGHTDLEGAQCTNKQLQQAYVNENTIFPDGRKYSAKELREMGMRLPP